VRWFVFTPPLNIGDVAQMVERLLSMQEAQGSIPCFSTIFFFIFFPQRHVTWQKRVAAERRGRRKGKGRLRPGEEAVRPFNPEDATHTPSHFPQPPPRPCYHKKRCALTVDRTRDL
jgi:hypothetical protein